MARLEPTTSVKVQWSQSHPEGQRPYFTYRIQTSNPTGAELVVNTSSIVVTGLDPGTQYTFNVTAVQAFISNLTCKSILCELHDNPSLAIAYY